MSTAVISVRVKKELKEEAIKLNIDLKKVIEKALEEEIKRIKKEKLKKIIEEGLESMSITVDEWIKAVKESRRER